MEGEFFGIFLREKFQGFSLSWRKSDDDCDFFFFEILEVIQERQKERERELERVRKRKKETKEFCCLKKHEIERIFSFHTSFHLTSKVSD